MATSANRKISSTNKNRSTILNSLRECDEQIEQCQLFVKKKKRYIKDLENHLCRLKENEHKISEHYRDSAYKVTRTSLEIEDNDRKCLKLKNRLPYLKKSDIKMNKSRLEENLRCYTFRPRDERKILDEILRLERSLPLVDDYHVCRKKNFELTFKKDKLIRERDTIFSKLEKVSDSLEAALLNLNEEKQRFESKEEELKSLQTKKNLLIEQANEKLRKRDRRREKENMKRTKTKESFNELVKPSLLCSRTLPSYTDLFVYDIAICEDLIRYSKSLIPKENRNEHCKTAENSKTSNITAKTDYSSECDESSKSPGHFYRKNDFQENNCKTKQKKNSKRKFPNKPIGHPPEIIAKFTEMGILIPKTISNIPETVTVIENKIEHLKKVKEQLISSNTAGNIDECLNTSVSRIISSKTTTCNNLPVTGTNLSESYNTTSNGLHQVSSHFPVLGQGSNCNDSDYNLQTLEFNLLFPCQSEKKQYSDVAKLNTEALQSLSFPMCTLKFVRSHSSDSLSDSDCSMYSRFKSTKKRTLNESPSDYTTRSKAVAFNFTERENSVLLQRPCSSVLNLDCSSTVDDLLQSIVPSHIAQDYEQPEVFVIHNCLVSDLEDKAIDIQNQPASNNECTGNKEIIMPNVEALTDSVEKCSIEIATIPETEIKDIVSQNRIQDIVSSCQSKEMEALAKDDKIFVQSFENESELPVSTGSKEVLQSYLECVLVKNNVCLKENSTCNAVPEESVFISDVESGVSFDHEDQTAESVSEESQSAESKSKNDENAWNSSVVYEDVAKSQHFDDDRLSNESGFINDAEDLQLRKLRLLATKTLPRSEGFCALSPCQRSAMSTGENSQQGSQSSASYALMTMKNVPCTVTKNVI